MSDLSPLRDKLKEDIMLSLGAGGVRVELKDNHLEYCVDQAIVNYRQHSSGSVEEAWLHLTLSQDQSVYVLPQEVQQVRQIFRRGHGQLGPTAGANLDPFSLAYANNYMLSAVKGTEGGLLTYDLQHQFQETIGRMFGRDINFNFNRVTKELTLHRDVRGPENVMLWAFHMKPEEQLLADYMIYPLIRDLAKGEAKIILGRIRGKISAIPGPNGPINLNGDALIEEGKHDIAEAKEAIKRNQDGGNVLGFIIG